MMAIRSYTSSYFVRPKILFSQRNLCHIVWPALKHLVGVQRRLSTISSLSSKHVLSQKSFLTGSLPGFKMPTAHDIGFFFSNDHVLTSKSEGNCIFPLNHILTNLKEIKPQNSLFIGEWEKKNLFAVAVDRFFLEKNDQFQLLHGRDVLKIMDAKTSHTLCRAKQLLYWHLSSLYCGSCGTSTKFSETEIAKCCEKCNKLIFPSTFPAVIVLIVKDKHILLSRSPHFPAGMYSTMAGFVEAGESLEATIHREVEEELGIRVKDLTYFGSQSWPFPNSLMVGFRAKYDSGEIRIDKSEIEDAGWYSVSELPLLPPVSSIARHLIDSHIKEYK